MSDGGRGRDGHLLFGWGGLGFAGKFDDFVITRHLANCGEGQCFPGALERAALVSVERDDVEARIEQRHQRPFETQIYFIIIIQEWLPWPFSHGILSL
jgi:hypothetical protein